MNVDPKSEYHSSNHRSVLKDSKYSQGSNNPEETDAREDETEVRRVSFSEVPGANEFRGASSAIRSYSDVVRGKKGK
jgi:hypothetical protein